MLDFTYTICRQLHADYMLNVFVHDIKVTLEQWSVRGDKTNEPGCLKKHLEKLFETWPTLKLLTGDAIFAQRPLLEALEEYECDYLFQVRGYFEIVIARSS